MIAVNQQATRIVHYVNLLVRTPICLCGHDNLDKDTDVVQLTIDCGKLTGTKNYAKLVHYVNLAVSIPTCSHNNLDKDTSALGLAVAKVMKRRHKL